MNHFSALDSRNRRNLLAHSMNAFSPPFHKNYSTGTTADMKTSFGDGLFINTMHLIPEPMKMNLADSVGTINEKYLKTNMATETKVNNNNMKKPQDIKSDYYPSLAGITNFFSGVFNVMGAIFQKRANSPVQYYDCYEQDFEDHHQMTPSSLAWQSAKREDQNINGRAQIDEFADETYTEFNTDMNNDCRAIAGHCEDKLNQVRLLLSNPQVQVQRPVPSRRPKRAFHESGSVEELFEDAFDPEELISLANETFLQYCSPINHHHEELQRVDAPKVKTDSMPIKESIEIEQSISHKDCGDLKTNNPIDKIEDSTDNKSKSQIVSSCEDKVNQLKALLRGRCSQKTNLNEPIRVSTISADVPASKPISIPNKSDIELPVTTDVLCDLNPTSYFDEVTGRFYSSSATDSEDSFQIVFSDSPRNRRKHIPSDCESEDSFIVFEESPNSCYTSNDVFADDTNDGTNISDSEDSDSDCESDLDSGLSTITLSHSLTRTFGDLTDGSLYEDSKSEDVVDCAFSSGAEIPKELIDVDKFTRVESQGHKDPTKRGLLLDEIRKRERRKLPDKKVHFSPLPPKVHVMRVWAYAARQARAGHWERHALDRERFKRRIADVEVAVSWVLKPQHRSRVMFQRFMPWWNAQKRKELAEQKQKEEEDRLTREKEEAARLAKEDVVRLDMDIYDSVDGVVKLVQEGAEEEGELVRNEVINVSSKLDGLVHSAIVEHNSIGKTNINKETGTVSDNKIVSNETEAEKLCNGYVNVNSRIDSVTEENLTRHRKLLQDYINSVLPKSKNTDRDTTESVLDNLTVINIDVALKYNNASKTEKDRAEHQPAS